MSLFRDSGAYHLLSSNFWAESAWNVGTCLNMAWTALACLDYFVNSLIWNDNLHDPAPVWCDISMCYAFFGSIDLTLILGSRVQLASVVAVPAAVLCTIRRIYFMTSGNMPSTITEVDFTTDSFHCSFLILLPRNTVLWCLTSLCALEFP